MRISYLQAIPCLLLLLASTAHAARAAAQTVVPPPPPLDYTLNASAIIPPADEIRSALGLSWKQLLKGASSSPKDKAWMQLPSEAERAAACEDLGPLYADLDKELEPWKQTRISRLLQAASVKHQTTRTKGKAGIALGFKDGKAYVTVMPKLHTGLGFHGILFMTYIKVMSLLEQLFGIEVPDVEFVISTVDRPLSLPVHLLGNTTPEPVFRFCKTPAFADVLIPNFHSYMTEYTGGVAMLVSSVTRDFPWADRDDVLFGRFTPYFRHAHPLDPHAYRQGAAGEVICTNGSRTLACSVRSHICDWSGNHTQVMDISCIRRTSMAKHAEHKYLLHLDGQGLSSRFEQLLFLNSLIFKEESGYVGYFYHMLQPHKHFIPVWKEKPEEILDALDWAKSHDSEAQVIAQAAQDLAVKFLGPKGRACFWLNLLRRYAALLDYPAPPNMTINGTINGTCKGCSAYWRPAEEWAYMELRPWLEEHKARNYTFVP